MSFALIWECLSAILRRMSSTMSEDNSLLTLPGTPTTNELLGIFCLCSHHRVGTDDTAIPNLGKIQDGGVIANEDVVSNLQAVDDSAMSY